MLKIYQLDKENARNVAVLMHRLKAEWWSTVEDAYNQLTEIDESIKTVGWYLGEDSKNPRGWILCRELVGYRALELECSGFDDDGVFKLEHKLGELFKIAEEYAKSRGYLTFRSGISSVGFNIHGKDIDNIPTAIAEIECERIDYKWYLGQGFRVIGIQPNAYEKGFHLIMLGKDLS